MPLTEPTVHVMGARLEMRLCVSCLWCVARLLRVPSENNKKYERSFGKVKFVIDFTNATDGECAVDLPFCGKVIYVSCASIWRTRSLPIVHCIPTYVRIRAMATCVCHNIALAKNRADADVDVHAPFFSTHPKFPCHICTWQRLFAIPVFVCVRVFDRNVWKWTKWSSCQHWKLFAIVCLVTAHIALRNKMMYLNVSLLSIWHRAVNESDFHLSVKFYDLNFSLFMFSARHLSFSRRLWLI